MKIPITTWKTLRGQICVEKNCCFVSALILDPDYYICFKLIYK